MADNEQIDLVERTGEKTKNVVEKGNVDGQVDENQSRRNEEGAVTDDNVPTDAPAETRAQAPAEADTQGK